MQLHVLMHRETVRYVDSKERRVEVCCVTQYALGSHCHMQPAALPAELPHTVAGRSQSEHCEQWLLRPALQE